MEHGGLRSKQRSTVWALHNKMARRCASMQDFHETGPLGPDWLKVTTKNPPSVPESAIQDVQWSKSISHFGVLFQNLTFPAESEA